MTVLALASFTGEVPKVNPRYLPAGGAQSAFNARLDDGILTPMRWSRFDYHFPDNGQYKTIFKNGSTWMGWKEVVNVVRGPVAENRLYVTGDGVPQLIVDGNTYGLGVPYPTVAPQAALTAGTVDDSTSTTVVYAYTWVTEYAEESEPSNLSNEVTWSPNCTITLSGFGSPPLNRAVTKMRIYRSVTGSDNSTNLYFLAERDVSVEPYVDAYGSTDEEITSSSYDTPPDDMQGIIALPNGMMAAFTGKTICFCEPYLPHAWPEKYQLQVDYDIVGLGAFGSSMIVMTSGYPYLVTGTAPENMTMERLETNLPCINARSIVDLGYSIAYASPDGLVVANSSGCSLASQNLISREDWIQMNPGTMVAGQYSGRYMASYNYVDADGANQQGLLIIDMTGQQPFLIRGTDKADALYYELSTSSLYLLVNGSDIYQWDDPSQPPGEIYWRSKQCIYGGPLSFGCILIEAYDTIDSASKQLIQQALDARIAQIKETNAELFAANAIKGELAGSEVGEITFGGSLMFPIATIEPYVVVTIWAGGKQLCVIKTSGKVLRLPVALESWWEVEIRTNMAVSTIRLAQAPMELAS